MTVLPCISLRVAASEAIKHNGCLVRLKGVWHAKWRAS